MNSNSLSDRKDSVWEKTAVNIKPCETMDRPSTRNKDVGNWFVSFAAHENTCNFYKLLKFIILLFLVE